MTRAKYMRWTDELIKEKIFEAIEILKINRMPKKAELNSINMIGLSRKITQTKGFSGWADELGLQSNKNVVTLEIVEKAFSSKNLVLVTNEYKNSRTKMEFYCNDHPDTRQFIHYNQLTQMNGGCKYCGYENFSKKMKIPFEDVLKKFDSFGFDLLETNYINSRTPMKCVCRKHPDYIQEKTYSSLVSNEGCKYCGWEESADKRRHDFDVIRKAFKKVGLTLLEQNYEGQTQKLKCICPKHENEILEMTYANVSMGHGCKHCAYEFKSEKYRGENSGYYKGGISPVNVVLREELNGWRLEVLKKHNFRCYISGIKMNDEMLEVHHVKSFHEIRDEILREMGFEARFKKKKWRTLEFTEEEMNYLKAEIVRRHTDGVGFPITKSLHKEFHRLYGRKATVEDFQEFVASKSRCEII